MQHSKKVKVDMNPKRVQNPQEQYKRSPGKFDQKVYMEQESFSSNAIREMARVHAKQINSVSNSFEKDKSYILKKKAQLESKNTGYNYLKQLRQAFNEENKRRIDLATKVEEFARMEAERQNQPEPQEVEPVVEEEPQKNYRPWETNKPKLPSIQKAEPERVEVQHTMQAHGHPVIARIGQPNDENGHRQPNNTPLPPVTLESLITGSERSMLENLSKDIMAATLPSNRLRRIIPDEDECVGERYPIMSKYRKHNILPEVKKFKRKMNMDTSVLHNRIQQYFGVHIPLSTYIIPKSAKPRKHKLLKAISHEDFRLPKITPGD